MPTSTLNFELLQKQLLSMPENKFWELYRFVNLVAKKRLKKKIIKIEKDIDFWSDEEIEKLGKIGYNSGFFK